MTGRGLKFLAAVAALLGLCTAALVLLDSGWVRDRAIAALLDAVAEDAGVGAASGGLLTGLRLEAIHLRRADGLTLDLDVLEIEPAWLRLLDDEFALRHLRARGARLRLPTASPAAAGAPLPAVSVPMPLRIERLLLADIEILNDDWPADVPRVLQRLDAEIAMQGSRLTVGHLRASMGGLNLQGRINADLTPPYGWQVQADLSGPSPLALPWSGPVELSLDSTGRLDDFQAQLRLRAPVAGVAQLSWAGQQAPMSAHIAVPALSLQPWVDGLDVRRLELRADGEPRALAWRVGGDLTWAMGPEGLRSATTQASGSLDELQQLTLDLLAVETPAGRLGGQGRISFDDPLQLAVAVDSDGLDLTGLRPGLQITSLQASVSGTLHQLDLSSTAILAGSALQPAATAAAPTGPADAPPVEIQLNAQLDHTQHLRVSGFELRQADRLLHLQGELDLAAPQRFDVQVQGTPPQLASLLGLGSSQLEVSGSARGTLTPLTAALEDLQLRGEWNGAPVQGQGQASWADDALTDLLLDLQVGDDRLQASGQASADALDLQLLLDVPTLALLWPAAAGSLQADLTLGGTSSAPGISGQLKASGLLWSDLQVDQADLDLTASASDAAALFGSVTGHVSGLRWLNVFSNGALDLQGNWPTIRAEIAGQHPDGRLKAMIETDLSAYKTNIYKVNLETVELLGSSAGDWALAAGTSARLASTADQLELAMEPGCLVSGPAQLCWEPLSWGARRDVRVRLTNANLDRLQWLLREDMQIQAPVHGELVADANGMRVGMRVDPGFVRLRDGDDVLYEDTIEGLRAEATWQGATLSGEASANFTQAGKFTLTALGQLDAEQQLEHLRAELDSSLEDLGLLEALLPGVTKVRGALHGSVRVEGPPAALDAYGELALEFAGDIDAGNLHATDGRLRLRGDGGRRISLDGGLALNETPATIAGEFSWPAEGEPAIDLSLDGEAVPLAAAEDISVRVSPQLRLHGPLRALRLDGSIDVPEARVRLTGVPQQGPQLSDDVIIHDPAANTATAGNPGSLPLAVDLRLTLGRSVRFIAGPLDTRIEGALRVVREGGRPLSAAGRLQTADGTIKAFGEPLQIRQGQLFFDGAPDNPAINVLALRRVENQEVGIRATGYLRDINTEMYSAPQLDDAAALTMLITGKPIANTSSEEIASVRERALSAGIAGASPALTALVRNVGLDELTLQQPASEDSSALIVGKRIDERIYARYRYGLRTQSYALLVEYQLNDRVILQSETGTVHGIDILFRREYQ